LLYLAKRLNVIAQDSFSAAYRDFIKIFPMYQPKGIGDFVNQHWIEIN